MIPKIMLTNLSPHIVTIFVVVVVVKTLKIYSLSKFQVYNIKLLTIITILYIRFPVILQLKVCTFDQYLLFSLSPQPLVTTICYYESDFWEKQFSGERVGFEWNLEEWKGSIRLREKSEISTDTENKGSAMTIQEKSKSSNMVGEQDLQTSTVVKRTGRLDGT